MIVLLWNPSTTPFGGHLIQAEMTARYLSEAEGVEVRVCRDDSPDWTGIDVVHGLGLSRDHIREARRRGIPVCLSVIYASKAFRTGKLVPQGWRTAEVRLRAAAVLSLAALQGSHASKCEAFSSFAVEMKALYESADMLLPNSSMEAATIRDDLEISTPMRVVPNAADASLFARGLPWSQRSGVLYVGRIEPHKNQLNLLRALRGTSAQLTIVGPDHPHHPKYADAVRAEAHKQGARMLSHVRHEDLPTLYAGARVHALPSGFETTGLVSLEAGLSGCNVVSTAVGYAREYLGDLAWYCDPHNRANIRTAVLEALHAPPSDLLRERILSRYTWEHTASATMEAYRDMVR